MKKSLFFIFLFIFFNSTHGQVPQLLKDINSDTSGADFYDTSFLEYNGKAYFSANDGISGTELWATDGTAAGTERVTDISQGSGSSFPRTRILYNNLIYFSAYDTSSGQELWASDGTSNGTFLVKDIFPGFTYSINGADTDSLPNGSGANNFFVYKNRLYFSASDAAHGNELWSSDGTDTGTVLVKDINPGTDFSFCSGFIEQNGTLFFTAKDGVHGYEPWKSDGTAAGTMIIKDIFSGLNDGYALGQWYAYNNKLYFSANDGMHGFELWETDGTDTGTRLVIDLYPGPGSGYPSGIAIYQNAMFFPATDSSHGREVWKSDGTIAGTVMVKDVNAGVTGSFPTGITAYANKLFFKATDVTSGGELWSTDGTESGTHLVSDVRPGISSSSPRNFVAYGGQLYFVAIQNATDGLQLYRYSDSTGITSLVAPASYLPNACTDNDMDSYSMPVKALGMLIYPATYDSYDTEFYKIQESVIGIEEPPEKIIFSLFPVPAISTISIELNENQPATAMVFNVLGEMVISKQFNDKISLDISRFAPGIFSVNVITSHGNRVKTFVKR
jgi:ELWxxDGT repeat protein